MNKKHYEDLLFEVIVMKENDVMSVSSDIYFDNDMPTGKLEW